MAAPWRLEVVWLSLALVVLRVASQEGIPEGCSCTDTPPPGQFSCADQVQFGKCSEQFMTDGKHCEFSCGVCKCDGSSGASSEPCEECPNDAPSPDFTCEEQERNGACGESWMEGFCMLSCGKCSCPEAGASGETPGTPEGEANFFGAGKKPSNSTEAADEEVPAGGGGANRTADGDVPAAGGAKGGRANRTAEGEAPPAAGTEGGRANGTESADNSTATASEVPAPVTPAPASKPAGSACLTIYDTVEGNSDLSQLKALLEKAEFMPVVDDPTASVTFFAPINAAIEALSESLGDRADDLLENPEYLTKVLNYHVSKPALFQEEMAEGDTLTTVAGKAGSELELSVVASEGGDFEVSLEASDGAVAQFLETDIVACEAIVHVIDAVMVSEEATTAAAADPQTSKPGGRRKGKKKKAAAEAAEEEGAPAGAEQGPAAGECMTVLDTVKGHPDLTSLAGAIQNGGVIDVFGDAGLEATLFAPSSEAFEAFGETLGSDVEQVLGDPDFLKQLLAYHTTLSPLLSDQISPGDSIPTTAATPSGLVAADDSLKVVKSKKGAGIAIKGFKNKGAVVEADLQACDSVVHVIDRILMSKDLFELTKSKGQGAGTAAAEDASADPAEDEGDEEEAAALDEAPAPLPAGLEPVEAPAPLPADLEPVEAPAPQPADAPVEVPAPEVSPEAGEADGAEDPVEDEPEKKKKKKAKKPKGQKKSIAAVTKQPMEFGNSTALPDGILADLIEVVEEEIAKQPAGAASNAEPGCTTVLMAVEKRPDLSVLKDAFEKGGFFSIVSNSNLSATFLAPTNDAFAAFTESLGSRARELMTDPEFLSKVLAYHVALPAHRRGDLKPGDQISTLASLKEDGASLTVIKSTAGDDGIAFADAVGVSLLVEQDIEACSCIVHVIDRVLVSDDVAEIIGDGVR